MWGLVHSIFETAPVAVMILSLSYSVSKPWCAAAGAIRPTHPSTVSRTVRCVLMPSLLFLFFLEDRATANADLARVSLAEVASGDPDLVVFRTNVFHELEAGLDD